MKRTYKLPIHCHGNSVKVWIIMSWRMSILMGLRRNTVISMAATALTPKEGSEYAQWNQHFFDVAMTTGSSDVFHSCFSTHSSNKEMNTSCPTVWPELSLPLKTAKANKANFRFPLSMCVYRGRTGHQCSTSFTQFLFQAAWYTRRQNLHWLGRVTQPNVKMWLSFWLLLSVDGGRGAGRKSLCDYNWVLQYAGCFVSQNGGLAKWFSVQFVLAGRDVK